MKHVHVCYMSIQVCSYKNQIHVTFFLCNFNVQTDFLNGSCLSGPCFFGPGYPPSQPKDLLDVLPAEATCLTAFAEAAEVEEALKSLEL